MRLKMFQKFLGRGSSAPGIGLGAGFGVGGVGQMPERDETHNALRSQVHQSTNAQTRTCNNRSQCVLQPSFQGWGRCEPREPTL